MLHSLHACTWVAETDVKAGSVDLKPFNFRCKTSDLQDYRRFLRDA